MKKLLSLILALTMLSSLAGALATTDTATFIDYTGMTPAEMVEANRSADWTITEEPVTLTVMIDNTAEHPADMNEQELFQRMEKNTGIHVEWIMPGSSAFGEQKSLALASGDMPDIILNGLSDSEIARYGADGVLADYKKLMEEYPGKAPNIEKMFNDRPDILKFSTAPDGGIYSMPRINEGAWMKQNGNTIINVEWLKNLGLEMPTSIYELKDVLIAFRDQDANGNGDPNDEIPLLVQLSSSMTGSPMNMLMAPFGVIADNQYRMLDADGNLVCSATQEGWKEGMKYMHDLYAEGLIDPEAFTMDGNQHQAKLASETPIVGVAGVWDIHDQVVHPRSLEIFDYIKPLTGIDGAQSTMYKYAAPGWDRSGCVISAETKHPEEALRWVDYLYDKVNSMEMIEGVFYERLAMTDEGYFAISEDLPEGMDSQYVWRYSCSPGHSGSWCVQENEYNTVLRLTFTEPRSNFNDEFCAPLYVEPFPAVFYTPEESEEMLTLNAELMSEIARQSAEWIMNGGVDEEWDAYIAKLDAIGMQRWLEINTAAMERYNAQ